MVLQQRSANISSGVVKDWLKITNVFLVFILSVEYNYCGTDE